MSIQNEVEAEEDVAPTVPAPWLHLGNLGVPDCHRYVPNKRMAHKDIMDITKFTLYRGVPIEIKSCRTHSATVTACIDTHGSRVLFHSPE